MNGPIAFPEHLRARIQSVRREKQRGAGHDFLPQILLSVLPRFMTARLCERSLCGACR